MKARYLKHIMDLSSSSSQGTPSDNDESSPSQMNNQRDDDNKNGPSTTSASDNNNTKRSNRQKNKKKNRRNPPRIVETDASETPPPPLRDDEVSSGSETPLSDTETPTTTTITTKQKRRSPFRYFVYALLLWMLEFGTALLLKRFGIQLEFNETVVQNVFEQQLGRFNESMPRAISYLTQEKKRPGFQLAAEGASHHYPVVLVHGFVTSGLEVWAGKACARQHFRQRFWAALYGARSFLSDRDCWKEHMQLDPETGLDPPGIRLRAASGFEAVDYFMANCKRLLMYMI